mmetsp:Transcript_101431/g.160388  ORF Transcript_101431/g.160388 Transcript_101431/m.160388 type:complete len:382 (-) Transcript_101431:153-1298(-)
MVYIHVVLFLALPFGLAQLHQSAPPPQWVGMVINMKRRSQRLQRFRDALLKDEPWLLRASSMCRILGRDGEELATAISNVTLPEFEHARAEAHNASHLRISGTLPAVPASLRDPVALLADGWITEEAIIDAGAAQDVWPQMTAGGVGLYLSHAAAWQYVLNKNLDYGLIFEDDLTLFSPSFEKNVSSILSGYSQWWDMLYLQRCDDELWPKRRIFDHVPGRPRVPNSVLETYPVVTPIEAEDLVPCTGAYIITREGAEKLLRHALPANEQLDKQIGRVANFKRAALSPPVAQCWEIFKNKHGHYHRDTDVQTNQDNDGDYSYWKKQNEAMDKWMKDLDEKRRRDWAETRMGRNFLGSSGMKTIGMHSVLPDIQDCSVARGQ